MRTEQLVYLREIYHCSSLNKASENLHVSTQALSLSIKNLEQELNFKLLDRSRTGVSFTPKGLLLLQYGEEFLEKLSSLTTGITPQLKSYFPTDYSVYITKGLMESFWPKVQSQLLVDFPKSTVTPIIESTDNMFQLLSSNSGKIEIGLINQVFLDKQPVIDLLPFDLSFQALQSGTYSCTISQNLRISSYKTISLNTIAEYPVILYEPSYPILEPLIRATGKKTNIIKVDNYQSFRQLVADGRGITFSFGSSNTQSDVNSIPNTKNIFISDSIVSQLGYVYRSGNLLSTKSLAIIQYLTTLCERY